MKLNQGTISEIQQTGPNERTATIRLAQPSTVKTGQYFQAYPEDHGDQPVGVSLFPGGFQPKPASDSVFITAPPIPAAWNPGSKLTLYGPLGRGFSLPQNASRVALAALGETASHLLPLAGSALTQNAEVALFTDGDFPQLPAKIEISPLTDLQEAIGWADYLALSGTWPEVAEARDNPALSQPATLAEVLVLVPMPCSALAACGVCAVTDKNGRHVLVCEDGPVFDWKDLHRA